MHTKLNIALTAAALMSGILLLYPVSSHAVPAMHVGFEVTQPDGTRFMARTMGDEFQGWMEDSRGYAIARDKQTGRWEYAVPGEGGRLKASGVAVRPDGAPPAGFSPGLRPKRNTDAERSISEARKQRLSAPGSPAHGPASGPSQAPGTASSPSGVSQSSGSGNWDPVPVLGDRHLLIILVNFADRSLITTPNDWDNTTFMTTGGAASLKNYFEDNSFGAMTLLPASHSQPGSPAGIIEVSIATNHPNYGGNYDFSTETAWLNLALYEAEAYVDFASYDTSADGRFQDSELVINFIPAGYETSGTSKTPSIWAHAWGTYSSSVMAGGVALGSWTINGELNHYDHQHPMGVIAHELGHTLLGLPDLYDTSLVNRGMGGYSLMAYGSWGSRISEYQDIGNLPVPLDAWCREYVGWSAPRTPTSAGSYSFPAALSAADAPLKLINTDIDSNEYFLVENRPDTGWDLGLESWIGGNWGGGLLIQHIDNTVGTPVSNNINRYDPDGRQGVLVVEADSSAGSLMDNTSVANKKHLYYDPNNDSLTSTSVPDNLLYDGKDLVMSITGISTASANMSATIDSSMLSSITYPYDGNSYTGMNRTISGAATGGLGPDITLVELSFNNGAWIPVTGTNSWTYDWTAPGPGLYNIRCRATDADANVEVPGGGITVYMKAEGFPELTHYYWDWWLVRGDCSNCHHTPQTFLPSGYKDSEGFCYSCHNTASVGHERTFGLPGHGVMASITSAGITMPTYGNYTGEYDNRLFANLPGNMVTCVTCHNIMQNPEDVAREWEMTTTSDNITYTMQNGSWDESGYYEPKVYRDTSLWSGPGKVIDKRPYIVDRSEYSYDDAAGTINFHAAQDPADYIYVTLDFPSLRVSTLDNRLCSDCHPEQTHSPPGYEFNCLDCHVSHGTGNIRLVRENLLTPDTSERAVEFRNLTGTTSSFSNMSGYAPGPCEVCHTQTLYHNADRTGQPHHDGEDCTTCHGHATGFPSQ